MRSLLCAGGLLGAILMGAASLEGAVAVDHVGVNPFPSFPSTGGTGQVVTSSPTDAVLEKTFTSLGDVPIIINAGPSPAGGMESFHINERVRNNSGTAWTDFHLDVGGIDANPALLVEFQNVLNSTGEFTSNVVVPNALSLFGNVPNGGDFSLSFDIKITDPQGAFALFGIHERPSVPEPSSLALAGIGLAALLPLAKKRIRKAAA
jgi:hypothetical protein